MRGRFAVRAPRYGARARRRAAEHSTPLTRNAKVVDSAIESVRCPDTFPCAGRRHGNEATLRTPPRPWNPPCPRARWPRYEPMRCPRSGSRSPGRRRPGTDRCRKYDDLRALLPVQFPCRGFEEPLLRLGRCAGTRYGNVIGMRRQEVFAEGRDHLHRRYAVEFDCITVFVPSTPTRLAPVLARCAFKCRDGTDDRKIREGFERFDAEVATHRRQRDGFASARFQLIDVAGETDRLRVGIARFHMPASSRRSAWARVSDSRRPGAAYSLISPPIVELGRRGPIPPISTMCMGDSSASS